MQILDGAVFAEHVLKVLLGGLLVHVGDDDDPAFDGADGGCACFGARVAGFGVGRGVLGLVNVHLGVGHSRGHGCGVGERGGLRLVSSWSAGVGRAC
jgi:hypothetical protein